MDRIEKQKINNINDHMNDYKKKQKTDYTFIKIGKVKTQYKG